MDAGALQPAVSEDLPGFHAGEGMLDTGADLAVGSVVLLVLGRQFALPAVAAVRDDQVGAPVTAVRDHGGTADGGPRAGQIPCPAVVAVPRYRPSDHNDHPCVCVDDDLVIGGVPVVLGLLGDVVVAGGHERAVDDEHGAGAKALSLPERKQRPNVVDDAVGS